MTSAFLSFMGGHAGPDPGGGWAEVEGKFDVVPSRANAVVYSGDLDTPTVASITASMITPTSKEAILLVMIAGGGSGGMGGPAGTATVKATETASGAGGGLAATVTATRVADPRRSLRRDARHRTCKPGKPTTSCIADPLNISKQTGDRRAEGGASHRARQ